MLLAAEIEISCEALLVRSVTHLRNASYCKPSLLWLLQPARLECPSVSAALIVSLREHGVCLWFGLKGQVAWLLLVRLSVTDGLWTLVGFSITSSRVRLPLAMGRPQEASISFDSVRDKNIMQLRKLNTAIFPVTYQDKFYNDALNSGDFTKLAYYNDICVGSIACRLEKKDGGNVRLYIMTLGVLAPYRRLGIGSKLLQNALDLCKEDPNIVEVYLHVQINNDEAIEFYKQFGFEITDTLKNYYKRIDPPHCHVLSKTLVPPGKSNGDS